MLGELREGQSAFVKRVPDTDPDLLRYLADVGVIPQTQFRCDGLLAFRWQPHNPIVGQKCTVVLGPGITSKIFVEIVS